MPGPGGISAEGRVSDAVHDIVESRLLWLLRVAAALDANRTRIFGMIGDADMLSLFKKHGHEPRNFLFSLHASDSDRAEIEITFLEGGAHMLCVLEIEQTRNGEIRFHSPKISGVKEIEKRIRS